MINEVQKEAVAHHEDPKEVKKQWLKRYTKKANGGAESPPRPPLAAKGGED